MQKLIEKYEDLRDAEEVSVVKRLYDGVVNDLQGLQKEADEAKKRADFQKVLDELERAEKFSNPRGGYKMCDACGMPCEVGGWSKRRALPNGSHRTICLDCLSKGGE